MNKGKSPQPKRLILLLLLIVTALLVSPFLGFKLMSWGDVFNTQSREHTIFWQIRVPRVIVSTLAGAGLALCGLVFQAMLRNPLVSPFTLGVTAGASLGASFYIWAGLGFSLLGISGISVFSFLGACLSILFVWSLSRMGRGNSMTTMLLAGVVVSFFFASFIIFLQYLSSVQQALRISRWLMGGIYVFGYEAVFDLLPFILLGSLFIWAWAFELNILTTGEELATSRGVNVQQLIKLLFFLVSLMIGNIVAVCGPIAFVGIMVPHMCRLILGGDHRVLVPGTFLFGGLFLTLCDTLARTLIAPAEIPVGVITALLGGPFFLWLLVRRSSQELIL